VNKTETAKVLTIASGFDRRQVDEMTVEAWASALTGYTFEQVQAAVVQHFRDPATRHDYLGIAHVLDRLERDTRARAADVEADVRSAKARGLIEPTHPAREPLPDDVKVLLFVARERDRETARVMALEVEA
jgi:hypothetical protein